MTLLCHDDRHGIACPQPCDACAAECDPAEIYDDPPAVAEPEITEGSPM